MESMLALKRVLTMDEVAHGYRVLCSLYPHIPSLIIWRGWEYAAYQRYTLDEPALDLGCGDGRFVRLIWPTVRDVIGIDLDNDIAEVAKASGIYREVKVGPAHELPFESNYFASVFANCSLEHMDRLSEVFENVSRCLRPAGKFLFSVVTDKLLEWATLPLLLRLIGEPKRAASLLHEYIEYHHMINLFSPQAWAEQLSEADLVSEDYIPIVPELTARFFLLLDHLWHVPREGGEVGDALPGIFATWPNFGLGIEEILRGLLHMERDWNHCGGAVFCVRKKG